MDLNDIEVKALRTIMDALNTIEHAGRKGVLELANLMHTVASGSPAAGGRPSTAPASKPAASAPTGIRRPGRPAGSKNAAKPATQSASASSGGSGNAASAKQYLRGKNPQGAIARTAVLIGWLSKEHGRDSFTDAEINDANNLAGGEKFSNVHTTVNNAIMRGIVERSDRGMRKLSKSGLAYVEALPDRRKANAAARM